MSTRTPTKHSPAKSEVVTPSPKMTGDAVRRALEMSAKFAERQFIALLTKEREFQRFLDSRQKEGMTPAKKDGRRPPEHVPAGGTPGASVDVLKHGDAHSDETKLLKNIRLLNLRREAPTGGRYPSSGGDKSPLRLRTLGASPVHRPGSAKPGRVTGGSLHPSHGADVGKLVSNM